MTWVQKPNIFAKHGCSLKNPSLFDTRGLIAGSWKDASSNSLFPVYEPATGTVLENCASFGREEFTEAIDSAYGGYQEFYHSTTAKERGAMLRRWNDLILQNKEDCIKLLIIMWEQSNSSFHSG